MKSRFFAILSTTAVLAVTASLAVSPAAHAQIKLKYAHVGVANAPQTLYADEVAKLIKERTNGRIEIQVFPNSQLGGVGELVDGVKSGAISMGHHDFASLGKILSSTAVFNTPFVYRDPAHSLRATDSRTSPALREINQQLVEKGNMRIVGSFFQGTRELTSKEKVLSPKDMQGKKYRGVPVKLWSSMLTGMGAVATPVEVSELATALATGLVVGQENPLPNIYNLKLYEVQKYVMMTNHMQSVLSVFVNEKVWQSDPGGRPQDHGGHDGRGGREDARLGPRHQREVSRGPRGQGHDLRRGEGRPRHRGVPQGGAGAGQQGLPGVDRLHRADPGGAVALPPHAEDVLRVRRLARRLPCAVFWTAYVRRCAASACCCSPR